MVEVTLHKLMLETCSEYPDHLAAIFDDGCCSIDVVTYNQVLETANTITSLLRQIATPGEIIGLYAEPCINLPALILGILQRPAAYAPIDPHAPDSIDEYFIREVGIGIICVQGNLFQHFANTLGQSFDWEPCNTQGQEAMSLGIIPVKLDVSTPKHNQCCEYGAKQSPSLAYALHTSGTTGRPKIVGVPHACIVPNILDLRSIFSIREEDVVFMASPLTFDPSVVEMFMTWSRGAALLIVPTKLKMAPNSLARVLTRNHVTVLQATPALVSRFPTSTLQHDLLGASSTLRILAFGGESCPTPSTIASWRGSGNRTEFFNLYGITEVSSWASCFKIPMDWIEQRLDNQIPFGDPLKDTILQVRDEFGRELSSGMGELFIGGSKRVCFLNSEKLHSTDGELVMRATGDVVEVTNRGLFFIGREDDQVKRHGKRLSLLQIKQAITACPEIDSCDVILDDGKLVAFYTSALYSSASTPALVKQLGLKNEIIVKPTFLLSSLPQSSQPPSSPSSSLEEGINKNSLEIIKAGKSRENYKSTPKFLTHRLKSTHASLKETIDTPRLNTYCKSNAKICDRTLPSTPPDIYTDDCEIDPSLSESAIASETSDGSQTLLHDVPQTSKDNLENLPTSVNLIDNEIDQHLPGSVIAPETSDGSQTLVHCIHQPSKIILDYLRRALPSHGFPDMFVALYELPITRHGKVDTAALKKTLRNLEVLEGERKAKMIRKQGGSGGWKEVLIQEWKNCFFMSELDTIYDDDTFLTMGGDSFQALRLVESLEHSLGSTFPNLLDVLLHHPMSVVCQTIEKHLHPSNIQNNPDCEKNVDLRKQDSGHSQQEEENDYQAFSLNKDKDNSLVRRSGKGTVLSEQNNRTKRKDDPQSQDLELRAQTPSLDYNVSIQEFCHVEGDVSHGVFDMKENQSSISQKEKVILSSDRQLQSLPHQPTLDVFENQASDSLHRQYSNENNVLSKPITKRTLANNMPPKYGLKRRYVTNCSDKPSLEELPNEKGTQHSPNIGTTTPHLDNQLSLKKLQNASSIQLPSSSETLMPPSWKQNDCTVSVSRGSLLMHHSNSQGVTSSVGPVVNGELSAEEVECSFDAKKICIEERWKVDTGKCVDASPLVVCTSSSQTVYIGSHSHCFYAISMETGCILWESSLGDRVESSACLSACGKFVIVGCYDHFVYCLSVTTGDICWRYETGDVVKSSPICDLDGGLVYIGSHDMHVVALKVQETGYEVQWRSYCGGGSVFATPCVHQATETLIAATLRGHVVAFRKVSGEKKWSFVCPKPVFSSPVAMEIGVLVGCVDGIMYCISHAGLQLWTFKVNGPIFSSPCLSPLSNDGSLSQRVVFGSHDGSVTCLDPISGQLAWSSKSSNSPVYSTPFIFTRDGHRRVAAASTDGRVSILDLPTGKVVGEFALPGEVFSSPVVVDGKRLVVGCRNDYVYCLDLRDLV